MVEDFDKEAYCLNCNNECCDLASCPMFGPPAADAAPVVHGEPITKMRTVLLAGYHKERGYTANE